jgi:hypothetical protein
VDVPRPEREHERLRCRPAHVERRGRDAAGVAQKAQERGLVPSEVEVAPLDTHHWAAVEQPPLGDRVDVDREPREQVRGVLHAREELESAVGELVRGHLRHDVGVATGGRERLFGPLEVGVGRPTLADRVGANDVEVGHTRGCEPCVKSSLVRSVASKRNRLRPPAASTPE